MLTYLSRELVERCPSGPIESKPTEITHNLVKAKKEERRMTTNEGKKSEGKVKCCCEVKRERMK
jgi:hypothetical protein